jgi:hypothetical protein
MKSWYAIKAQGEDAANIDIFEDIGLGYFGAKRYQRLETLARSR